MPGAQKRRNKTKKSIVQNSFENFEDPCLERYGPSVAQSLPSFQFLPNDDHNNNLDTTGDRRISHPVIEYSGEADKQRVFIRATIGQS